MRFTLAVLLSVVAYVVAGPDPMKIYEFATHPDSADDCNMADQAPPGGEVRLLRTAPPNGKCGPIACEEPVTACAIVFFDDDKVEAECLNIPDKCMSAFAPPPETTEAQDTTTVVTISAAAPTDVAGTTVAPNVTVTTGTSVGNCTDSQQGCVMWAAQGECEKNPYWMIPNCQKSCASCGKTVGDVKKPQAKEGCTNGDFPLCQFWADFNECEKNPVWMKKHCKLSCNAC